MLTWTWIGQIVGKRCKEQKETEIDILRCVKEGEALSGMQNNIAISALKPCLGLLLGWGPAPHTICWLPFQMVNKMWVVDEAPWRERVSIQAPTFGLSRVPAGGGMGCRPHQALDESLLITKMGGVNLEDFPPNKRADRRGAPQASYDIRRHRNCFPTRPAQAFPKKINISWGQRSVDAIKPV